MQQWCGYLMAGFGLWVVAGTASAGGPPVYVGSGAGCHHASLAAAVAATPDGGEIRIAMAELILDASLVISNRQLRIVGGYSSCSAAQPTSASVLRAGVPGAPVVTIDDNIGGAFQVELVNLRITGGSTAGNGGGLRTVGTGTLTLSNTHTYGNQAQDGGGLYVDGDGAAATTVELRSGSRIGEPESGNLATRNGGGLYCTQARVRLGDVNIQNNLAAEDGGGMQLVDCEVQPLDEPGATHISDNRARNGAGIYAMNGSMLLLSSTRLRKVAIEANLATEGASPQRGGGVFLTGAGTRLVGEGLWVQNNRAVLGGGGLFLTQGAQATLGRGVGVAACAIGDEACSRLDGNRAADQNGNGGNGGAALVLGGSQLVLAQTRVHGNQAGNNAVLRANGVGSAVRLDNVLLVGNHSGGHLLSLEASSTLDLDFATIADNQFALPAFNIAAGTTLGLQRSILHAATGQSLQTGTGVVVAACINSSGGAFGGDAHAAGFTDAARGNYRLGANSQNLDRCAIDGNEPSADIAGQRRNIDRAQLPNNIGPLDRGAFEDVDEFLRDGFES